MPEGTAGTVLVADDREENRYIVSRILRAAGFAVIEARSGCEALAKAGELPDLIVLDIRLPDMTGYEVCRRIRMNSLTRGIPVLHLSASFVTSESKVMSLEGGADAYLTQPVEPPVLIATVRALLRLRKAESLSRLSARQWQVTFDSLAEGIGLLDAKGRIQRCNRAMSEMTGMRYSQIEGQPLSSFLAESLGIEMSLPIEPASHSNAEVESRHHRWFRISTDPILDNDGFPSGRIFVLSDISDSKRAQEALRMHERLAATGRLAHSIAHEINNPLEALTNLLYLIGQGCSPAQLKEYVAMATTELSRVSRITKQTLAFNRESSVPVEINVGDLVDSVVSLHRPQISSCKLSIRQQVRNTAVIMGFPAALQQVLSNLLSNAMEASQAGGAITLRVSNSRDWADWEQRGVRITIADQGRGISPDALKKIFDPFFTTKGEKGSGLGLWLSLGIIVKHGGRISVRSSSVSGKSGSCFSIFLPRQSEVEAAEVGLARLLAS